MFTTVGGEKHLVLRWRSIWRRYFPRTCFSNPQMPATSSTRCRATHSTDLCRAVNSSRLSSRGRDGGCSRDMTLSAFLGDSRNPGATSDRRRTVEPCGAARRPARWSCGSSPWRW